MEREERVGGLSAAFSEHDVARVVPTGGFRYESVRPAATERRTPYLSAKRGKINNIKIIQ